MAKNKNSKGITFDEFKLIIEKYILKLLGLTKRNVDNVTKKENELQNKMIYYKDEFIYFKASNQSSICCKVAVGTWYSGVDFEVEIKVLKQIIKAYSTFFSSQNDIDSNHKELIYEYALQTGLCSALLGCDNEAIHKLINKLEEWSCKTYEGKKVPFAFLIDSKCSANEQDAVNYLDFLELDFSATISDGITSIIELDSSCRLLRYKSICMSDGVIGGNYNEKIMPLRFAQILSNYVTGNRIGIFLLVNGDIILAKSGELLYVKRNNKWTNFSSKRYINTLLETAEFDDIEKIKELLSQIYATTLDVSFSHSGGIIAVVNYEQLNNSGIVNFMDDLYPSEESDGREVLLEKFKKLYKTRMGKPTIPSEKEKILYNEFEKLYTKRQMIKKLLGITGNKKILFSDIDRKLRAELCGLDGATILDLQGHVIAFGAIIQNNSGSSGGGRGAAASRLSDFDGFATKISTDGYIELYRQGEVCYQIK